jgi:hypothetical protein
MKKSYLKGAIIALIFIFILFLSFNFLNTTPMLSPGAATGQGYFDIILVVTPLLAGFLIVVLVFFLIMHNFE